LFYKLMCPCDIAAVPLSKGRSTSQSWLLALFSYLCVLICIVGVPCKLTYRSGSSGDNNL
jgi:hypothetical protein